KFRDLLKLQKTGSNFTSTSFDDPNNQLQSSTVEFDHSLRINTTPNEPLPWSDSNYLLQLGALQPFDFDLTFETSLYSSENLESIPYCDPYP
ncbi:16208_t:CDS:1, partial [Cetraspora pellucida]